MATLPSGNEAVLVGCFKSIGQGTSKNIYKLKWQGEQLEWELLLQKMKKPITSTVAMFIPDSKLTARHCNTNACNRAGSCVVSIPSRRSTWARSFKS